MARMTLHFREHPLRLIPLTGEHLRIGRDPGCEIHIDSLALEERHARLERREGVWSILPESGEAAVFVNGERIRGRYRLQEGDVVRVGKHSLHYSEETAPGEATAARPRATVTPLPTKASAEGYLQFLNGSHIGRTIRLDRAMTRLGKRGRVTAMIARRRDGYYLSHLEGEPVPEHNGDPVGDHARRLTNGDRIRIGDLELQFFLESLEARRPPAAPDHQERRFTRVPFPVDARLHLAGGGTQACRVLDLSLKGALVEIGEKVELDPGRLQVLEIPLEEDAAIRMEVEAVRIEGRRLGLTTRDIDVDSITHLRRLVELNSGDPELLERELAELG